MSQYISDRQLSRESKGNMPYAPALLEVSGVRLQRRTIPADHELKRLLLDTYELFNAGDDDVFYPVLPSGCVTLVFLLHASACSASICGATTTLKKLRIPPKATVFCCRLCPGAADWILPVPVCELTEHTIPLESRLEYVGPFLSSLKNGESFHERNVLLGRLLNSVNASQYAPMALVVRCAEIIHASQGMSKVAEIAEKVGCSKRYLNRVFQEHVGVSTKLYCEIVQLQFSLKSILYTKPKSLLNIAVTFGYFDQTHMNRAYRKFLGCTASDMRYVDRKAMNLNDVEPLLQQA